MDTLVSQNFHPECEFSINEMINMELHTSYVYFSMIYNFSHHAMAQKHLTKFFREQSQKKKEHAEKLLQYLIKRGRRAIMQNILKPEVENWLDGLHALEEALVAEKIINHHLLELYKKAKEKEDPHLCGFLQSELLGEQVKIIKLLGRHITNLKILGLPENGVREYLLDKYKLEEDCESSV